MFPSFDDYILIKYSLEDITVYNLIEAGINIPLAITLCSDTNSSTYSLYVIANPC